MHSSAHDTMSKQRAQRAEALLRAIVGIADAHVTVDDGGAVARVVVYPSPGSSARQAARNAASALLAGLGVRVIPELVSVASADDVRALRAAVVDGTAEGGAPLPAAAPAERTPPDNTESAKMRLAANGDVNGATDPTRARTEPPGAGTMPPPTGLYPSGSGRSGNGAGRLGGGRGGASNGAAARVNGAPGPTFHGAGQARDLAGTASPAPTSPPRPPHVHAVDVRRIDDKVRCHVTIAAGGRRFAGAGEAAADSPAGMMNLVARVTTEAVRASVVAANSIQYDGASIIDVAERRHVVVALHQRSDGHVNALAGAAPITERIEDAAARAALAALREVLG